MTRTSNYNTVAIALHWAIAILILAQIAGGFYMHNLPNSAPQKFDLYQLHKSFGLSVFALTLVRLAWRLTHKPPALPSAIPPWQRFAAHGTHWIFYALMLITPLVGLIIVSVSPKDIPTLWFGIMPIPHLGVINAGADPAATEHFFIEVHEALAFTILGLLALHVAAALKHGFVNQDGVLRSMSPFRSGALIGIAAVFAALGVGALIYFSTTKDMPPEAVAETMHDHDAHDHTDDGAMANKSMEIDETELPANASQDAVTGNAGVARSEPNSVTSPGQQIITSDDDIAMMMTSESPCGPDQMLAPNWRMIPDASALAFIGTENDRQFTGEFEQFGAEIAFHPDRVDASWVRVVVETRSAKTGDQLIDATIPGGEWFDTKDHPTATFTSCSIRNAGNDKYEASGALTIKEISHEITVPFSFVMEESRASASGKVELVRTEFDLGAASSWLEDEGVALGVEVQFDIQATSIN